MTDKTYTGYSIQDLIHDDEFVETVRSISSEKEWHAFLAVHADAKENMKEAKKIISLFEVKEQQMPLVLKHQLWVKIADFNKTNKKNVRRLSQKRVVSIAASVIVFVALAGMLYLSSHRDKGYSFSASNTVPDNENTVLMLANGKKIEVEKAQSNIAVLDNKDVQIDNDTVYNIQAATPVPDKQLVFNELVIPYGKKTTLTLSDGTKVWLNAGTRFAFPQEFRGKKRRVFIDGEGYFEVSKNEKMPFVVSSKNMNVEVLGTKFNMNAYSVDDICETVLLEGKVNVWNADKLLSEKVEMVPNQKASFRIGDKQMLVEHEPHTENYIAWIDGWYKFKNENLRQVFLKLGRYYNITFVYDDAKIGKALPVSGKLDLKETPEEVMKTLSMVAEFSYEINENKVIVN